VIGIALRICQKRIRLSRKPSLSSSGSAPSALISSTSMLLRLRLSAVESVAMCIVVNLAMRNVFAPQTKHVPAVERSSATPACAIIWRIVGCVVEDLRRTVKHAKASATSRAICAALPFASTMVMNAPSVV
jgi:hypothetical protein